MFFNEKIKINFGAGKVGLTFEKDKGYLIINKINTNNSLEIGSEVNTLHLSKSGQALNNSYILSGDLKKLAEEVQKLSEIVTNKPKALEYKNFVLDFSNANQKTFDIFIQHCYYASKAQHINVVI